MTKFEEAIYFEAFQRILGEGGGDSVISASEKAHYAVRAYRASNRSFSWQARVLAWFRRAS